jgi:hypothetical protein
LTCGWDGEAKCLMCGHDNEDHPVAGTKADEERKKARLVELILNGNWFTGTAESERKRRDKAS